MFAALVCLVGTVREASAQILKKCDGGITLKTSAASTVQGGLLLVEIRGAQGATGFSGEWDGKPLALWTEEDGTKAARGVWHGLLGVDLEHAPGKMEWKVSWKANGKEESCSASVTILKGKFLTEHLTVEKQFVEPAPEQEKRAAEEQKKVRAIYGTVTPEVLWQGKFQMPLKIPVVGKNFGRRRVLNGQARSPHGGVDFPAATGTPVYAAQSGKVALAEELFYSGNTVILDHGFGIYTMYAHLSAIEVKAGDAVSGSTELGKVGATGRVTGPHLHWGMTVGNARVNAVDILARRP